MISYIIFRPDGHYGYPIPELSDKFISPYSKEKLLEFYVDADCSAPNMNDEFDNVEGVFDEWGDSTSFHTTYIITSDLSNDELESEIKKFGTSGDYTYIGALEIGGGEASFPGELEEARKYNDYNGIILNRRLGNANVISINQSDGDLAVYKDGEERIVGSSGIIDDKNLMIDTFDTMSIEDLKEFGSCLPDLNTFGMAEYLKDIRGFDEDDLNDLKVMARMKKRSKYT